MEILTAWATWLLHWTLVADTALLRWANAWVARSPKAFYRALEISHRAPWVLAAVALVWMWFWGDEGVVPVRHRLTRLESRRRVLTVIISLVGGFFGARALQAIIPRLRPVAVAPLQVPIPPHVWDQVRASLELQGAFPSDHAVLLFVIAGGLYTVCRRLGWFAGLAAVYFSILRVGLGFHWPTDMVGGALVGWGALALVIFVERHVSRLWDWVILLFYRYPRVLYPLGFVFLFDLSQKFSALFGLISWVLGHEVSH
ncbi:MAG: phosphatase PAP2 family protein [Chloroflexi bacterium]|nr:phosphatase PAP2 family protein [Chloroflexota bacterium]